MLVCCTSDLHGSLPKIPDCDLLLIGGDLCGPSNPNAQYEWLAIKFCSWVMELVERGIKVVGVEGNHGILAGRHPEYFKQVSDTIPWTYLEDSSTEFDGKIIWGTPSSLPFGNGWAFNVTERNLEDKFDYYIPENTDIIISHGPPYGIGDVPGYSHAENHTGSVALKGAIDRIHPKLVVCGHIHGGYGLYEYEGYNSDKPPVKIVNAAYMDEEYRPEQKPILVEI